MTRRALTTVAVLALLLLSLGAASAQEPPDPVEGTGQWRDTKLQPAAITATGATLTGSIRWSPPVLNFSDAFLIDQIALSTVATSLGDCPAAELTPPSLSPVPFGRDGASFTGGFELALSAPCNGRYSISTRIRPNRNSGSVVVSTPVVIASRPAPPTGLDAEPQASRGRVALEWSPSPDADRFDFLGYEVSRTSGGERTVVASSSTATTFVDDADTSPGASHAYEVRALRAGPDGAPLPSDAIAATAAVPDPGPDRGGNGNGNDNGGSGGSSDRTGNGGSQSRTTGPGRAGSDEPSASASSPGDPGGGRPSIELPRRSSGPGITPPRTGTGRVPTGALPSVTPTTIDDGYSERLPFDSDREVGPRDAVLPDDELAAMIFDEQGDGGAGVAVPAATASVLALWALHLRHLNTLARRP